MDIDGCACLVGSVGAVAFIRVIDRTACMVKNDASHSSIRQFFESFVVSQHNVFGEAQVDDDLIERDNGNGIVYQLRLAAEA